MSYNIDTWKTKKLKNLIIPLKAFFKHERTDWHPTQRLIDMEGGIVLECGCGQEIRGTHADGKITVTEFAMTGEGSGTFFEWILAPALKESTGWLEAVLIWEGGDSIQRLNVKDGRMLITNVDL